MTEQEFIGGIAGLIGVEARSPSPTTPEADYALNIIVQEEGGKKSWHDSINPNRFQAMLCVAGEFPKWCRMWMKRSNAEVYSLEGVRVRVIAGGQVRSAMGMSEDVMKLQSLSLKIYPTAQSIWVPDLHTGIYHKKWQAP